MQYYQSLHLSHPNILREMEEYINGGCSLEVIISSYEAVLTGNLRDTAINAAIWLKGAKED